MFVGVWGITSDALSSVFISAADTLHALLPSSFGDFASTTSAAFGVASVGVDCSRRRTAASSSRGVGLRCVVVLRGRTNSSRTAR